MDICILTYNRLVYLQKCFWSIIASSKLPNRIFIFDDCSTDGTKEFILHLKESGLINDYIFNDKKTNCADNCNRIIDLTSSENFVITNDDMYFHRGWDEECFKRIDYFEDCGIVSFYNYQRIRKDEGNIKVNDTTYKVQRTGLGASIILRELYEKAGKFKLNDGQQMGYFATPFCSRASEVDIVRNKHYVTIPHYATHMDDPTCKLNEREALKEYCKFRSEKKIGCGK